MNAIQLLSAQPWVEHLGSTLLHFLWQGIFIAAAYAAVRKWFARSCDPSVRYVIACAALVFMAAAPVLTWTLLGPAVPESVTATFTVPLSATPATLRGSPASFPVAVYRAVPAPFLPLVVAAWFAGALAFCLRLTGGWLFARQLRSRMVWPAPPEWQLALDRLKARIRVSRPVCLLLSALVRTPSVVGWLRPVVLVPVGALSGLPPEQVEAILLHELAHIRRHDYLVNAIQSVVEALLFYHPAVWWVSGHIRMEREHCCDDAAVSASGDVLTYARALAEVESARAPHLGAVMAANGGSLAHRIARLLGQPRPSRSQSGPGILAGAIILVSSALAMFGQPAAGPKFEVASIKLAGGRGFMMVRPLPGRLTASASVRLLMQNAYGVQPFQIVGGPEWVGSDHYEIEAKTGNDTSRARMFLMLQSLLEDRYQLKIHRETKELPVYALVPVRSGLKLPPPKEGGCVNPSPDATPEWAGGRIAPPGQGQSPLAPCGSVSVALEPGGARMQGGKVAIPEFIRVLSMVLGSAVIDRTGFTGIFDVRLNFLPDETTAALPAPPPGAGGGPLDISGPSILSAIQEQLGLRLESTRGPVDVIVIDHIERPSVN